MRASVCVHAVAAVLTVLGLPASAQPSAEDLHTEGQAAYDRADYATAVAKWQASYDLSKESALLFNLAQAKRLAGDCIGALATYRRFVAADDADPVSEQHKLAQDLALELEETCPKQEPAMIPAPPKIEVRSASGDHLRADEGRNNRESPGRTWKIAGLVAGGAGVVTIAIGLGLGHHGASIGNEVTAACATSCDWEVLKDKDARGRREVTIGKALDAVGVVAIAGGAVIYYLGVRQETLAIAPTPGGGVVSWSGAW